MREKLERRRSPSVDDTPPMLRLRRFSTTCLDLLFPRVCVLCDRRAAGIDLCAGCAQDLPRGGGACARCARRTAVPVPACGPCLQRPPAFSAAVAPFDYVFPADEIVRRLKFSNGLCCARIMAELLGDALGGELADVDCLVAVPLHPLRALSRGFNQADEIARRLAKRLGMSHEPHLLVRVRRTRAQVGLARDRRAANVRGAFAAQPRHVAGRCIGLVDDVMTTGATLDAAARALIEAGAKRVTAIAFARAS